MGAGLGAILPGRTEAAAPYPIIDTHIHLFDPRRPQGVPWPPKDNAVLYKPALPDRFARLAIPFGITGAIEIECSTWLEDNQWVLDIAAKNPIIVGTIGHLEPGTPAFARNLERFQKNPLFLGIRYGNLWNGDLGAGLGKPTFVADLKRLAAAGLVLDTANPTPALMDDVVKLTDVVPGLRVVLDHVPQIEPPPALRNLAKRPQVFVKVSGVVRRVNGRVPVEMSFYKERLDTLFEMFGEDRVLYGSDWPNCDLWAEYPQVFGIVRDYFKGKSVAAAEKYFGGNSRKAYRWISRPE